MTRVWWRLTELLSRALAHDERNAVLGDLSEADESGVTASFAVLGLITRRQAAAWRTIGPWAGLLGLALPLGLVLSASAFRLDRGADLYLWIARNRTTISGDILASNHLTLAQGILHFATGSLLLICGSWICGVALARLSRGAIWINAAMFCLMTALEVFVEMSHQRSYRYSVEGWVFPLWFYTWILPPALVAGLVLFPMLCGVIAGRGRYERVGS